METFGRAIRSNAMPVQMAVLIVGSIELLYHELAPVDDRVRAFIWLIEGLFLWLSIALWDPIL